MWGRFLACQPIQSAAWKGCPTRWSIPGEKQQPMNAIERYRATYEMKPVDRLYRQEFGIWEEALARWKGEGMPDDVDTAELFGFDEPVIAKVGMLGWCVPAFVPRIEPTVIETIEEYEIVRDSAGRTVRYFKDRRDGFMPTYLKHAVSCEKDWEEDVKPLLSPVTPERWDGFDDRIEKIKAADEKGMMIVQNAIGGYMYLRALIGPEDVCYMFADNPGLIHKMMQTWLTLCDAVSARTQQHVEIDELFFGEDICYNHGLLISPRMVREFILPYYEQLRNNIRSSQTNKRLFLQVDTDGNCEEAIELYRSIGMNVMSPFEIAAGNDVVAIAKKYPDLVMKGGIDKRVLAAGKDAIDEYLERIMPFMVERGGYIPMCDHGVPDNVSFEDYLYYRKRIMELDH